MTARHGNTKWTEEEDSLLRRLYAEGLTMVQIGKRLGHNRNTISGRCYRLGLKRPRPPRTPKQKLKGMARGRAAKKSLPVKVRRGRPAQDRLTPAQHPSKRNPRPSDEIWRPRTCQYPHGDPKSPDFHFCGAPITPDGRPYCDVHEALCTVKYVPKHLREKEDEAA